MVKSLKGINTVISIGAILAVLFGFGAKKLYSNVKVSDIFVDGKTEVHVQADDQDKEKLGSVCFCYYNKSDKLWYTVSGDNKSTQTNGLDEYIGRFDPKLEDLGLKILCFDEERKAYTKIENGHTNWVPLPTENDGSFEVYPVVDKKTMKCLGRGIYVNGKFTGAFLYTGDKHILPLNKYLIELDGQRTKKDVYTTDPNKYSENDKSGSGPDIMTFNSDQVKKMKEETKKKQEEEMKKKQDDLKRQHDEDALKKKLEEQARLDKEKTDKERLDREKKQKEFDLVNKRKSAYNDFKNILDNNTLDAMRCIEDGIQLKKDGEIVNRTLDWYDNNDYLSKLQEANKDPDVKGTLDNLIDIYDKRKIEIEDAVNNYLQSNKPKKIDPILEAIINGSSERKDGVNYASINAGINLDFKKGLLPGLNITTVEFIYDLVQNNNRIDREILQGSLMTGYKSKSTDGFLNRMIIELGATYESVRKTMIENGGKFDFSYKNIDLIAEVLLQSKYGQLLLKAKPGLFKAMIERNGTDDFASREFYSAALDVMFLNWLGSSFECKYDKMIDAETDIKAGLLIIPSKNIQFKPAFTQKYKNGKYSGEDFGIELGLQF